MKAHSTFKTTLLAAALATAYGSAFAGEGDEEVRRYAKPDSSVSIGIGHWTGDRQQVGKYDHIEKYHKLDDGVNKALIDADIRLRDDATGTWTTLSTRNLGYESREVRAGYERQGDWGIALEYGQTPSANPLTIMTGVKGIGGTVQTYGTVGATAAAAQTGLNAATDEVHVGTRRDTTNLSFSKMLSEEWGFNFNFRNEDRKGTQLWGRGSNPEFAVQPINWNTKQADASLSYTTKQLQLVGGISGSWFRNADSFVDTIGGSQTSAAGANFSAGHTFLSLPLDNQAWQYTLDGGYNFSKDTRATFKLAKARATQHDDMSAMTRAIRASGGTGTSSALLTAPGSLGGLVDNTTLNFGLTSRLMKQLTVMAKYDYNKRDDKTPVHEVGAPGAGLTSNPFGFKKEALRLEANYRLPAGYSLIAGLDEERREHQLGLDPDGSFEGVVKLRAKTDETTWRLQVRRAMSETVNGSIAYLHAKRDGSSWHDPHAGTVTGLPGGYTDMSTVTTTWTNPFAFADRTRNKWRAMIDWSPLEMLSLQFNYERSKDDYAAANSGLQKGKGELFSLDASLAINDDWQLNGWLSHDVSKADQRGITYDPRTTSTTALRDANGNTYAAGTLGAVGWLCSSANTGAGQCKTDLVWDAKLKDVGNSVGLGLKGKASSKLTLGADVQWTKTEARYPIDSNVPSYNTGANSAPTNRSKQDLPDIDSTMTRVGVYGIYALDKRADLRVDVVHQRWKSTDWTWMEWNSAGTSLMPFTYMDGTRMIADPNQSSVFLGVRYTYKFQ